MRNYLSFGGGVNSVAMMLYCLDEGWDFEAIFVNHSTDWPETYEYLDMFQGWLKKNGHNQVVVLKPELEIKRSGEMFNSLYDYCWSRRMCPSFMSRWCTDKFKIRPIKKHIETPCFQLIGIDYGESHRAKLKGIKGAENRFPLIEAKMNRQGCKDYIKKKGLPVPMKSGCYICPFQRVTQWRELRNSHPDVFCKAEQLEKRNIKDRIDRGKTPLFLNQSPKASLRSIVDEDQLKLFKQDEYPPCECML